MKKLKLDIQRFASTNKTTHYELSQYIGSDKPTYLVDYNQDMSKIDTGIYEADAKAVLNATNIGDLSELTTTDKLSLVNAINEVNSESSVVGDLQDLTTTDKTSVVGAVNEVNGKANTIGNLVNLTTTDKTSIVNAVNEVNAKGNTIGSLTNLTTSDKTSVVGAVNEVNDKANTIGSLTNLETTDKTSVVGAINEVNTKVLNEIGGLVWENPDPTATFGDQTITLSTDDYDYLIWNFKVENNLLTSLITIKGWGGRIFVHNLDGALRYRTISRNSDTSFTITTAHDTSGGNYAGALIPEDVIACKF